MRQYAMWFLRKQHCRKSAWEFLHGSNFFQAIEDGNFDRVKEWFSDYEDRSKTILHERLGRIGRYRFVCEGIRIVHYAAYYGNVDILEYFIEKGAGMYVNNNNN